MDAMKLAAAVMVAAMMAGVGVARWPELRASPLFRMMQASLTPPSAAQPPPAAARPSVASFVAASSGGTSLVLPPDRYGQFHTEIEVEGRRVPALVDTGASWVSLPYEVARALGYNPAPADFRVAVSTANGPTRVARVDIPEIRVGPIVVRNVVAMVAPPDTLTTGALLGMSFLRGLSGFSIDDGRLVLKQ